MKKTYTIFSEQARISMIVSVALFFTTLILQAQTPYIYIYSPSSGEVTYRNTEVDVTWYSWETDTVNLEYSLNNGSTWSGITSNYAGFSYTWTTPDTTSDQCLIRISSSSDPLVFGETGLFSIAEIPLLFLTAPNGGEIWNYNDIATVTWSGTNLPYYLYLDYSTDGGATWYSLGSGYSDSTGGSAQVYVPYVSSANTLVKIYDPYHPEIIADQSDQPFTIYTPPVIMYNPIDGDSFYVMEETYISWMATGISQVNIDLSTDGGLSWQSVAQGVNADNGYYYWTISGVPSTSCVIRVSDASDPSQFGYSGTFTLLPTPVITLDAPVGGEILNTNQPYTISWTYDNPTSYYLYLEFSTDNGQNWNYIEYVLNTGINGSYQWTTPVIQSEQCMIRISDYYLGFVSDSSNLFSILTYPATPICMVTVDSATSRNVIVWEKPVSSLISQFVVYKESGVAGIYEPVGTVEYDNFSTFTDPNSNPAVKSYRYKLGFSDAAGHIFPAGDLHQTIHLSINQGVGNSWNLIWTDYIGFEVGSYNIYRGTSPSDMVMVTSISASFNSYTDLEAPVGNIYYMVEVINPNGCTPAMKSNSFSRSRSNVATNKTLGMDHGLNSLQFSVYPNPVNDLIRVSFTGPTAASPVNIELRDLLGQVLVSYASVNAETGKVQTISAGELPNGIYMLIVASGDKKEIRKVVVKHQSER